MSRTTYVNASGLPDDDQITTARDQALLGRAIQERFPRYYRYFSTPSFVYHGQTIRNHNHLLGSVRRRRRHQDRIYPRLRLQSRHLGASRRPLHGRRGAGRPFGVRARRAHARADRRAHQDGLAPAHRAGARRAANRDEPVAFAKAPMASHADPAHRRPACSAPTNATGCQRSDPPAAGQTITYRTAPVQHGFARPMPVAGAGSAAAGAAAPLHRTGATRPAAAGACHRKRRARIVVASAEPSSRRLHRCGRGRTAKSRSQRGTRPRRNSPAPYRHGAARARRMADPDRRLRRRGRSQAASERGADQGAHSARRRRPVHRAGAEGRQGALPRPLCRLRQGDCRSRLQAAQAQRFRLHGAEELRKPSANGATRRTIRVFGSVRLLAVGSSITDRTATQGCVCGTSAMAAKKNVLGLVDAGREIRRPPWSGCSFFIRER